jgi:hypothetical protein
VPATPALQQRQAISPVGPGNQLPFPQSNEAQQAGQPGVALQDQTVTQSDQVLLGQLRQSVQNSQARIQGAAGAWAPIHFDVANGVVTIMGTVDNAAAKQQIESAIRRTPGVVSVLDQLKTTAETNPALAPGTGPNAQVPTGTASQSLTGGAMSPADQTLLLRVRQSVIPQIQVAGQPVPVNFTVQQGVVTVTGVASSMAQKRQIAALIQQVPGVVQVTDRISLSGVPTQSQSGAPTVGSVSNTSLNQASATTTPGVNANGITNGPNTSLTPTGRTNRTSLPPGLLRRDDLPPGLDRRSTLPPGLGGTNQSLQPEVR